MTIGNDGVGGKVAVERGDVGRFFHLQETSLISGMT